MSKAAPLQFTPIEEIPKVREALGAGYLSGKLRPISYRKNQLLQLAYLLQENWTRFEEAFAVDLGRHALETALLELNTTLSEAVEAYHKVSKWTKPEGVAFDLNFSATRPVIYKEPKGVVLVIGPFNYPVYCAISIVAGAIAAGCPCVVKMSEQTPTVSALIAELFPKYLDQDLFRIVNGGIAETTALLDLQWDHVVFTGSTTVGKIVAAAAAKHLTPVTLELGGQCPVIIDPKIDLEVAARRLLWGKFMNAGQTCMAPNHVFVPAESQDAFVEALTKVYDSFYPVGSAKSDSFSRVISDHHFGRVKGILEKTKGTIVRGGETNGDEKYVAATIVKDVKLDDSLMEAEIFGPILPIVPVKDFQEAIDQINARGHPLALYCFSNDAVLKTNVRESTRSGAVAFNEVCVHVAVPGLPFGGIGPSGRMFDVSYRMSARTC